MFNNLLVTSTLSKNKSCIFQAVQLFLNSSSCAKLMEPFKAFTLDSDFSHVSSPLHLAARNGFINIIKALLQAGMDINWKCSSGTCLHEAVANGECAVSDNTSMLTLFVIHSKSCLKFMYSE